MIDERVINAYIKGKKKGFDEIYKAYSSGMYAICLRYTSCSADAQDVLQESFIKVYNNREKYDPTKPIGAWIKTITIRTAINFVKDRYRFVMMEDDQFFEELVYDVEEEEDRSMKDKLTQALNRLPVGYRTVFNLYAIENLTHQEIADYLGISVGTSKSQYAKAKKMIRTMLQPEREKVAV